MSEQACSTQAPQAPAVLNAHKVGRFAPGTIYIGRPGKWGNPFSIGKDGDRDEVLAKYVDWLHDNTDFVAMVRAELPGKDLLCWCDPSSCHGHILRDIAMGELVPDRVIRTEPAQGNLFDF